MPLLPGRVRRASVIVVALLALSCESPPHKEMDQAQGAIDAARAAGAERYAPTEYAAANQALKLAGEAVVARDYRLALNYALESGEQAQNAARGAADSRAKLRGDIERSMAEIKALIAQARARLEGPSGSQVSRQARRRAQQTFTQLERTLQEADAALAKENYTEAQRLLTAAKTRIDATVSTISKQPASQSAPRHG